MSNTKSVRVQKQPRWKVIHDRLVQELPEFTYGSNFYTLDQICEKYDVSLITARRVLDELASQGLVEKIRKRGTVARGISQKLAVYMVQPSYARTDYFSYNAIIRRQMAGVEEYARDHNITFHTISDSHLSSIFFQEDEKAGFILPQLTSIATIDFMSEQKWPFVLLDPISGWQGLPHARVNRRSVGYKATKFLLQHGHRRIAHVLGLLSERNSRDRLKGYKAALAKSNIRFDWSLVKETNSREDADHAMHLLMGLKKPPTAIVIGDDNRAIQILDVCRRMKIKVPEQLSLLSYPGMAVTALTQPSLSVIDARYEEVGSQTMQLLLQQMLEGADPKDQSVLVEPQLIERASTAGRPESV